MEFSQQLQRGIMLVLQGICWLLACMTSLTKNLSKKRKISIILLEISSALMLIADLLFLNYNGFPGKTGFWMVRISKFSIHFFIGMVLFSFNLYLYDFLKETVSVQVLIRLRIVYCLVAFQISCVIISQFTGFYYTFDEANNYIRHSGRIISYISPLVILSLQLSCILQYYKKMSRRIRLPILLFTIIPVLATIVQFVVHEALFVDISIVAMAILLYIFTIQDMNDAVERAHQLEIDMMSKYQKELEQKVDERTKELRIANEKAESLLLNILPKDIAEELTEHPDKTISKKCRNATVLFTDIVGFTKMSSSMTAEKTVSLLNRLVSLFDERAKREGIEKIKTIGDAYMAACGLSENGEDNGALKMCRFAAGLLHDVEEFNKTSNHQIQLRIGINSGELVAGVIGQTKFIYDVWGDTVNVASRMESTGKPMRVQVSENTYLLTKNDIRYKSRVKIDVKGKGMMYGYYW